MVLIVSSILFAYFNFSFRGLWHSFNHKILCGLNLTVILYICIPFNGIKNIHID